MRSLFLRFNINIVLQLHFTEAASSYLLASKSTQLAMRFSFLTNKVRPFSRVVKLFISAYHIGLGFRSDYLARLESLPSRFLRGSVEVHLNFEDILMAVKYDRSLLKRLYFVMFPGVTSFVRRLKLSGLSTSSSMLVGLGSDSESFRVSAVLEGLFDFLKEDGYGSLYNLVDWPSSLQLSTRVGIDNFLILSLLNISGDAA